MSEMRYIVLHSAAAIALLLIDGWVLGQGVLSLLVLALSAAVFLPLWLSARGGNEELARRRGFRALVYGLSAACILVWTKADAAASERRARAVFDACRAFKMRHGTYPRTLEELVPVFLPKVPRAKRSLLYGRFAYIAAPDDHRLVWIALPPFGRRWVRLEDGRLGALD